MEIMRKMSLAALCVLLSPVGLHAGTIGPDCDSCFGGVYSISADLLSAAGSQETWRVTYGIDLTGYNGPSEATFVSSLAAKVVSGPNLFDWETVVPDGTPTGGTWNDTTGNLNSGGCDGSGGGWVCLQWTSGTQLLVGSAYEWVFDVTIKAGTLMDVASVQANFDPPTGLLMSEKVAVPEGGAVELPMLLTGLGFLLFWRRKALSSAN
jgi:hypothetical protein